jgi:phosphoribosylformimino-5-aminoimidazole carboxamide ribotide isomerase
VKTTDISRNGLLEGPSFDLYKQIIQKFPGIQILAGGGVRNVEDINKLNEIGVFAVIVGKALYEGMINLKDVEKFSVNEN